VLALQGFDVQKIPSSPIPKASQLHPQIIIELWNIVEFNLYNNVPNPDFNLEAWLLSLSDLKSMNFWWGAENYTY
jgi:hypothetical protein